jgi:hypothetical protein
VRCSGIHVITRDCKPIYPKLSKRLRNTIVHKGKHLPAAYFEPEGKSVRHIDTEGRTYYILADEGLIQYLRKHNMLKQFGILFEILPSFEYCKYLIDFGKHFFLKLYTDLKE